MHADMKTQGEEEINEKEERGKGVKFLSRQAG